MSSKPVVVEITSNKEKAKPAKSGKKILSRKNLSSALRHAMREVARIGLQEKHSYTELLELQRIFILDQALNLAGGEKKAAGELLGISRDHVRNYHNRGEQVLRP